MISFCYHWSWRTQWRVLLASPLFHNSNPTSRCLIKLLPIMALAFLKQVFWFFNQFLYVGVCYAIFLLSGSVVATIYTDGAQPMGFVPHNPSEYVHGRHMYILVLVHGPCQGCTEQLLTQLLLNRWDHHSTQTTVLQPFNQYCGAYSFGGLAESQLIPLPFLCGWEGSFVSGIAPLDDKVNSKSVLGIKSQWFWCDLVSGWGIYSHLVPEQFAQSNIYPGFKDKMLTTLTHFPLEPGVRIIVFGQRITDWVWSWFHPDWLHQSTGTGSILWRALCSVFSLFKVPTLSTIIFPVIQCHLGSGLPHQHIISLWILLTRRLMRMFSFLD